METSCSRFTPAEGGSRLAMAAGQKNILVMEYGSFIATRLIHEDAFRVRGTLSSGQKRTVYLTRASQVPCVAFELNIMTDLSVASAIEFTDVTDWRSEMDIKEVLVCTSSVLKHIMMEDILTMADINVLILCSCHLIWRDESLQYIMKLYKEQEENKPRILALTYPLFSSKNVNENKQLPTGNGINDDNENQKENTIEPFENQIDAKNENQIDTKNENQIDAKNENQIKEIENHTKNENDVKNRDVGNDIGIFQCLDDFALYEKLEWKIEELERELCCQMDLAEDIDSGKRLTSSIVKPNELIIEYKKPPTKSTQAQQYTILDRYMRETISEAMVFFDDHRYDPSEIYGDELYEEFKNIPDPVIEPKYILKQFLYVLDELGPYGADKAAFTLLSKLEKLKIKVPYERHFLLFCVCTTVFVKIRCFAELMFSKCESDWERINVFSTPKVMRFAEILLRFQPPELQNSTGENTAKMIGDLAKCDFATLGDRLQNRVNTYVANFQDLEEYVVASAETMSTAEGTKEYQKETFENSNRTIGTMESDQRTSEDHGRINDGAETDKNHPKETSENRNKTKESDESICNERTIESTDNSNRLVITRDNEIENKIDVNMKSMLDSDNSLIRTNHSSKTIDRVPNNKNSADINTRVKINTSPDINTSSNKNTSDITINESVKKKNTVESANKKFESAAVPESANKSDISAMLRKTVIRTRGRGRSQRSTTARGQQFLQNSDALCGIVFTREALMAKILFLVVVDLSRGHPKLSFLCAQYCAVETPADPGTEPMECQRQSKKQEEVLKKFRMHECNLLLATSSLEEGIDLPRCNLVLRWDMPASYRSYGLGRSRARANRACSGVLKQETEQLPPLAVYRELDQIISRKCGCSLQEEPPETEERQADYYTLVVKPYQPLLNPECKHGRNKISKNKLSVNSSVIRSDFKKGEVVISQRASKSQEVIFTSKINVITSGEKVITSHNKVMTSDEKVMTSRDKVMISDLKVITSQDKLITSEENVMKSNENAINNKVMNKIKKLVISDEGSKSDDMIINDDDKLNDTVINDCNMNKSNNDKILKNRHCDSCNKSAGDECSCTGDKSERDRKKIGDGDMASVDLGTAIALINRYCGKLPSDTFTRLSPQWWMEEVQLPVGQAETRTAYICTVRLPLNCPVKYNIVGHPMPTRVLARRMVALQACRILHKTGELDNHLMPIGKENFKAADLDTNINANAVETNEDSQDPARPGTTKRRQYYYKRTAWAFTDCQPLVDTSDTEIDSITPPVENKPKVQAESPKEGSKRNMLYAIVSKLWCALPERYNTRGRKLHAPQNAAQAIGILMARENSDDIQIPAFPVYTRSGEVRVSVEYVPDADVRMSPKRGRLVRRFMRFVFSEVLRVRRKGMKLQSDGCTSNNYYIVPTKKVTKEDGRTGTDIDWQFLELIYQYTEEKKMSGVEKPMVWMDDEEQDPPVEERKSSVKGQEKVISNPLLLPGETFVFDPEKYKEAVVTPWYRNQDQPQFFLVAEICWNLSPESAFPSVCHSSFREYYRGKYGADLTTSDQPLLDVDHTSARLNLLTPRYVNRKGVALPVSSERTRRAKRDRLDQKQILVPELCRVHPFAAPLWFATVALPCVLYRINALLIADEIRRAVAIDVGLGVPKIDATSCPGFSWPPLDFGWSLAEVLNADAEKKQEEGELKMIDMGSGNWDDVTNALTNESGVKEKTINDILQEKEDASGEFEIGTWSNDMASCIPEPGDFDVMEPLPPNLTFCTSASGGANWCDTFEKQKIHVNHSRTFSMAESDCSFMSSDFDTDDSDFNSESDEESEFGGFWSKGCMGVRIEYKTAHEAEAVDVERKKVNPAPQPDEEDDLKDRQTHHVCIREGEAPKEHIEKFRNSVASHEADMAKAGSIITKNQPIITVLPETKDHKPPTQLTIDKEILQNLFPYGNDELIINNNQITLESIEKNKRVLLKKLKESLSMDDVKKLNCFSMVDMDVDSSNYVNEKVVNVGFDSKECYEEKMRGWEDAKEFRPYYQEGRSQGKDFDFDYQPSLDTHPGPSPSVILQALTMSNANDGINLERLETIGDSFLKFAITAYLYCAHPTVHEGKLSHMRSKQVSNLNLYRLGRVRRLGARMTASKFEPHDNWLPPCHRAPNNKPTRSLNKDPNESPSAGPEVSVDNAGCYIPYNLITQHSIPDKSIADCVEALIGAYLLECGPRGALLFMSWLGIKVLPTHELPLPKDHPYLTRGRSQTEQIPQKSSPPKRIYQNLSDSEECSSDSDSLEEPEPVEEDSTLGEDWSWPGRPVGSLRPYQKEDGTWVQAIFGELRAPPSPLLRYIEDPDGELDIMLSGYDALERTLQYRFQDRSLLLQALTHASHQKNRLTDCYQRLEFLGDAVLDYLITRHLYEDPRRHSPGALTDLRSALVNNTIFATLAARHGFHKYFRHMSPGLNEVLTKYVLIQEENGHSISEEHYLIQEDEMEQAEDVEVPKALGDLFESVAGAIFLDSGMSLGAVWKSYVNLMGAELEAFSAAAPKSPVRELLEAEPDTAKFGKPERLADGRRVEMSSYGSMSPSDEGCERYEQAFYCQPSHMGSPMDGGVYWPATNEGHEFDSQEVYHDNTHYISRNYGYEDMQMAGNEPYDNYHHPMHHVYNQNTAGLDCDMQPLPLRYDRPAPPSFVRVVKRRTTANKKERRRTQSINTAFSDLRECIPNVPPDTKLSKNQLRSVSINSAFTDLKGRIPNVPPDTKLSKIKTLRLATSYISYLLKVLETDGEPAGGFRAELHHTPPRRRNNDSTQSSSAEKRGKGRTGWPQHVWALELKTEQNLPS